MAHTAPPSDGPRTAQTFDPTTAPDPLGLGPVNTDPRPPTAKGFRIGTRRINGNGYITVRCAGGLWESEGRLVVERILGRRLHDDEEIRHKQPAPPWDNREHVLELWRRGRPARLPRRATPRTPWKRLYLQAIATLEEVDVEISQGELDYERLLSDGTVEKVRAALDDRPG